MAKQRLSSVTLGARQTTRIASKRLATGAIKQIAKPNTLQYAVLVALASAVIGYVTKNNFRNKNNETKSNLLNNEYITNI